MEVSDFQLKQTFRRVFPEYSQLLENAKSQDEIDTLKERFVSESKLELENAEKELRMTPGFSEIESMVSATDQSAPIPLSSELYEILKNATGDTIKQQLQKLIDGLERLKNMNKDEPGLVTAQIILSGALGIGGLATSTVLQRLAARAVQNAAAYAGVRIATVKLVCAIAVAVIVLVIIPIIYYMSKPANCIVFLINELDKPLNFDSDHNVHGKPSLMTTPIPNGVVIPDVGTYVVGGLIATEKKSSALVGTQYGFLMKYGDTKLGFAVECPLTSLYEDNNCYTSFDMTAKEIAEKTAKENKQFHSVTKDGITLSLRVNSGSGSIAFYVARAYRA